MAQDLARGILTGIIQAACRNGAIDPRSYRIKAGGNMTGGGAAIEFYASMQNVDTSINTKKAKDQGLIRRCFVITQNKSDDPQELRIIEWSAKNDFGKPYNTIWSGRADNMSDRAEMMERFIASHREIVP